MHSNQYWWWRGAGWRWWRGTVLKASQQNQTTRAMTGFRERRGNGKAISDKARTSVHPWWKLIQYGISPAFSQETQYYIEDKFHACHNQIKSFISQETICRFNLHKILKIQSTEFKIYNRTQVSPHQCIAVQGGRWPVNIWLLLFPKK